jgi:hypothetical protein
MTAWVFIVDDDPANVAMLEAFLKERPAPLRRSGS